MRVLSVQIAAEAGVERMEEKIRESWTWDMVVGMGMLG